MIPFYKNQIISDEVNFKIKNALETSKVTNFGKYCVELESEISKYLGRPACLVASGTHALTLGLQALAELKYIPKDSKVLVPSFTFFASVHAIILAGMTPVFGDIENESYTLETTTDYYDIIMPVNIFGVQPTFNNFLAIGDLSHGFGSGFINGAKTGVEETVSCFSTSVTKPMHTIEGGIVAGTQDIVDRVKILRNWGNPGDYDCITLGQWSKISELHCIVGLNSIKNVEKSIAKKNIIAKQYKEYLGNIVRYQKVPDNYISSYKDFSILFETKELRDKAEQSLKENSIDTRKYFYPPVHKMKCFNGKYDHLDSELVNTIYVSDRILCLPIYDSLMENEIEKISKIIKAIC